MKEHYPILGLFIGALSGGFIAFGEMSKAISGSYPQLVYSNTGTIINVLLLSFIGAILGFVLQYLETNIASYEHKSAKHIIT